MCIALRARGQSAKRTFEHANSGERCPILKSNFLFLVNKSVFSSLDQRP